MPALNFSDFSTGFNVAPPTGWAKPTGSGPTQIANGAAGSGRKLFRNQTSTSTACWFWNMPYTTPVLRGQFSLAGVGEGSFDPARGTAFLEGVNGNGYAYVHLNGIPGKLQILPVINGQIQSTVLYSVDASAGVDFDTFYADYNTVTREFKLYQGGVLKGTYTEAGGDYNPTYIGVVAGWSVAGVGGPTGNVLSIDVSGVGGEIVSITDPIIMGGEITLVTTGFSTITSISGGGLNATDLDFIAGTTTGNWPAISESITPTVYLPATGVTITVSDGSNPTTIVRDIDLDAGWAAVEFGTQIDEPDYLLADVPIESGDRAYYETNQPTVGDVVIYPDGSVYSDAGGVVTFFLHKMGDPLVEYNVTAPAGSGEVAPVMPADVSVSIDEGTTSVGTYAATSGTEPIVYTLTGTDAADFSVSSTAVLTFTDPAVVGSYAVNVVGTNDYGTDSTAVSVTVDAVAGEPTIDSVGTIRIGGTAAVTVSGFSGAVNAGTYDGIALVSASNTEIQFVGLVNGEVTQRPGVRELTLTDGTDSDTIDQVGYAPSGWSSYTITAEFTESLNGVPGTYLPAGWAEGDFILTPSTSSASDAGISTGLNGTQELFLVDAVTGLATSFEVTTTGGGGGVATTGLGMRGLTMIGL